MDDSIMNDGTVSVQSNKIKLIKSVKGVYSWEISILNFDLDELERLNTELKRRFQNEGID